MPFSNGTYTGLVNSFNDAVAGNVIDPLDWNALFADIEGGINAAANGNGSAAPTDVASASTCNIGAAATAIVRITGSVTITSLGSVANSKKLVYFSAAPLLTYNATTLILPSAANITAAAGDAAIFISDASGNWRCVAYQRANGTALVPGSTMAGLSVLGRAANTSGTGADITGTDGQVLRVSGTALGFGTIVAAGIASDAVITAKILDANVTYAKIVNGTGLSVLGRAANSAGVNADITGTASQFLGVNSGGTAVAFQTLSGDATLSSGALTLASTISAAGPIGTATAAPVITYDAKGRLTTVTTTTITPAVGSITGLGTGVGTFLATPSSANLAAALTDETGSGAAVFATSPTLVTPLLGTPTSGVLTNCTGLPVAGGGTGIATTTAYSVICAGTTATGAFQSLASVGGAGNVLTSNGAGALPSFQAVSGTGTVTSVTGNGVVITGSGTVPPPYGLVNHSLAVSASGSALTIALKDNAGSDPSATSPVNGYFRNVTGTTGSWTQLTVTGALSLVISSGSTLGVTSSTAFRLWVVLFNDGGTARLGVINCSTTTQIYPLTPGIIASSTAEGGAGAADSAGVIYTGTAVTSKAYLIVGYIEWNTSGVTAGTWTTTNLIYAGLRSWRSPAG